MLSNNTKRLNGIVRNVQSIWLVCQEAWSLAACGYAGEPRLTVLKQQIRWVFAATINAKATLEWFQSLRRPELSMFAQLNPRLALKPMRVYVSSRWGLEKKIKIIKDTYEFIALSGSPLQNALTKTEGTNLASFAITSDYDAHIVLGYDNTYRKEGELAVSLKCDELGGYIISLVFSFGHLPDGEWAMYIGCIQGRTGIDNKPITKAMHGLWPKALILYVAQELACSLGIKHIFGVGNNIHSHRKKHVVYIPSLHRYSFDYDSLWTELGGEVAADGWFELPLQLQRRSHEDMKSNKRSMYIRRYNLLDSVSSQIRTSQLSDR